MGELDRGDAQHLVAEAGRGALEIGELLGGQKHAHPGFSSARQQRQHMVGPERRELVDADRRLDRDAAAGALEAVAGGADQILDRQGAELGGELAVDARVEAEQDHVGALERGAQVNRRRRPTRGRGRQIRPGMRLAEDRQPGSKAPHRADLVGREPTHIVLHALGKRRLEVADHRRQTLGLHQPDQLGELGLAPGGVHHLQCRLHVALGRTLIVGLRETLSGDELVLELGGIAVGQRVPVARPIGTPDAKRAPGQRRRPLELALKGR